MKVVFATLLGLLFFGAQQSASPSRGFVVVHPPKLIVTRFRLRAAPVAVTATAGAVWVVVETQGLKAQLRRLDSSSGRVRFSAVIGRSGPDFGAAAEADGVVFAAAGDHVIRVVAATAGVRRAFVAGEGAAIAIGFDSVWVASIGQQRDWVTRLSETTLAVEARIPVAVQPVALRAAFGSVWLATTESLQKIDPATDRSKSTTVLTNNPIGLLLFGGRLWLYQLDDVMTAVAGPGSSALQLTLPFRPGAVAVTPTRIWATDNCGCMRGTIALLNARTHRLIAEWKIGETPVALVAAGDVAYVATFNDGTLSRVHLSDYKKPTGPEHVVADG